LLAPKPQLALPTPQQPTNGNGESIDEIIAVVRKYGAERVFDTLCHS
jgi:hypothetical protein